MKTSNFIKTLTISATLITLAGCGGSDSGSGGSSTQSGVVTINTPTEKASAFLDQCISHQGKAIGKFMYDAKYSSEPGTCQLQGDHFDCGSQLDPNRLVMVRYFSTDPSSANCEDEVFLTPNPVYPGHSIQIQYTPAPTPPASQPITILMPKEHATEFESQCINDDGDLIGYFQYSSADGSIQGNCQQDLANNGFSCTDTDQPLNITYQSIESGTCNGTMTLTPSNPIQPGTNVQITYTPLAKKKISIDFSKYPDLLSECVPDDPTQITIEYDSDGSGLGPTEDITFKKEPQPKNLVYTLTEDIPHTATHFTAAWDGLNHPQGDDQKCYNIWKQAAPISGSTLGPNAAVITIEPPQKLIAPLNSKQGFASVNNRVQNIIAKGYNVVEVNRDTARSNTQAQATMTTENTPNIEIKSLMPTSMTVLSVQTIQASTTQADLQSVLDQTHDDGLTLNVDSHDFTHAIEIIKALRTTKPNLSVAIRLTDANKLTANRIAKMDRALFTIPAEGGSTWWQLASQEQYKLFQQAAVSPRHIVIEAADHNSLASTLQAVAKRKNSLGLVIEPAKITDPAINPQDENLVKKQVLLENS